MRKQEKGEEKEPEQPSKKKEGKVSPPEERRKAEKAAAEKNKPINTSGETREKLTGSGSKQPTTAGSAINGNTFST